MFKNFIEITRNFGLRGYLIAVYYGLKSLFHRVVLGGKLIQKKIYDYAMYLDPKDNGISRTLLLFAQRELDHKYMLEDVAETGMTILDIGANIGYYALMERGLIGEQGKIIAVEPSPGNVALLKKNLALNAVTNVDVIQGAISESRGEGQFHLAEASNLGTFHNTGTIKKHLTGETIKVETFTVNDIAATTGANIDLIRMDVEGHEVAILRSMLDSIREGNLAPKIIFETHQSRYGEDNDMAEVLQKLSECGYRVSCASSSSEKGTERLLSMGYTAIKSMFTDAVTRSIFKDIRLEDAINTICYTGGIRTVLLEKI